MEWLFHTVTESSFLLIAALYLFQKDKLLTVTEPNSLHMLWLIPQYFVLTMGEVMFSITGLEFSFTQVMPVVSLLLSLWNDVEQKYKIYRYGYHCLLYC